MDQVEVEVARLKIAERLIEDRLDVLWGMEGVPELRKYVSTYDSNVQCAYTYFGRQPNVLARNTAIVDGLTDLSLVLWVSG